MSYRVKKITSLAEVREIIALHNEAWSNSPGIIDLLGNSTECFVVVGGDEDRVVGYAFVQEDAERGHVELNDIVVDLAHRRHGCGELLMRHIFRRFARVKLCVRATDQKTVRFYRRMGFAEDAVFENYYDVGVDALRMSWTRPARKRNATPAAAQRGSGQSRPTTVT